MDADAGLVEAPRSDEANAVEELVERYSDGVYRLTMRITGVNEDAEAAARDALWAAVGRVATLEGEAAFGSWIQLVAAKSAYQKLRTRRPRAKEIPLDDALPSLDDDARHFVPMDDWSNRVADEARQGELRQVVPAAIDALPADYRTALVLHDVEGMSNPDIAEALGLSTAEVKAHVHRSRLFVRKRLSEYFGSV